MTPTEPLRPAAAHLREGVTAPARREDMRGAHIVYVGDEPLATCVDCGTVAETGSIPAALLVALLNAREPLAAVFDSEADYFAASPTTWRLLDLARAILGQEEGT